MTGTTAVVRESYGAALEAMLERGIDHCRRGQWQRGITYLEAMAVNLQRKNLPGLLCSYLGYGLALCHGRVHEGVRLCEQAVREEFYQPDNFLNLARAHLLAGNRRRACQAVARGLHIDRGHRGLLSLQSELGRRKSPVLPFLSRGNLLNRFLGRVRHDLSTSSRKR